MTNDSQSMLVSAHSSAPPLIPVNDRIKSATAVDAKYTCTPYQKTATVARNTLGSFAPAVPMLAREKTGYGIP